MRRPGSVPARRVTVRNHPAAPPRLQLELAYKMKVFLLLNIVPVAVAVYYASLLLQGYRVHLRSTGLLAAGVMLLGMLGLTVTWWWVVMPIAAWAKEYTRWQCFTARRYLWFVLLAPAYAGWAVTAAVFVLLLLMAAGMTLAGAYLLVHAWLSGKTV